MARSTRSLTSDDWVLMGLNVLAEDGLDGVRIERLAHRLQVSKGPFYWRFADRPALLSAMLAHWRSERTQGLIDAVAMLPTSRARLEGLVELALEETYKGVDVAKLEGAFRAWAAQSGEAAKVLREVDAARLQHLERELSAVGADRSKAARLSRTIYLGLVGLYTLRRYTRELASDDAYRSLVRLCLNECEAR